MITFPNAKINLGLNITERRSDGYHNIETVFYPIPICDALEIIPAKKTELNIKGLEIDGENNDNIVLKAYRLLQKEFDLPTVKIVLYKNIPFGAGLGGGSSDAAFMLRMLNEQFALNLSIEKLELLASKLGADCPFFIQNKPIFATGIGTVFSEIKISLKGVYIALIKPNIHVSSKDAYCGVSPQESKGLFHAVQKQFDTWKNTVTNDFENSVFQRYPEIASIKQTLYQKGAIYASMSGSGSSVFGLFDNKPNINGLFPNEFTYIGLL